MPYLHAILQNAEEGIAVIENFEHRYWNPSYERMLGYGDGKFPKVSPAVLIPNLPETTARTWMDGFIAGTLKPGVYALQPRRADGSFFDAEASFTAITPNGEPSVLVVLRDVSGHKELERKQMHYALEMESAAKTKTQFLVDLSHKLRGQLNSIIGYTELLLDQLYGKTGPKEKKYIQDISQASETLRELVESIITISYLEEDRLKFTYENFDAGATIRRVYHAFSSTCIARGVNLKVELPPQQLAVHSDDAKTRRVLSILVDYSVNHTPRGGQIQIDARERGGEIIVSVSDTGTRISPEYITRVFDYFGYVEETAPSGRVGGGLELALAKTIVDAMGGRIWAENGPIEGIIFFLALPRATEAPQHKSGQ